MSMITKEEISLQNRIIEFQQFVQNAENEAQKSVAFGNTEMESALKNLQELIKMMNYSIKEAEAVPQTLQRCRDFLENSQNPLRVLLMKHEPNDLLQFIKSNNVENFFTPNTQQDSDIIVNLLIQLNVLHNEPIALKWMEFALMDLDTRNRYVRENAVPVLKKLLVTIDAKTTSQAHMIHHLIQSHLAELEK